MAIPRLFVSSTCYDLQEIRFQLRNFIIDFGFDAVMSEFDDIFYNYETHVQDSCLEEINKCQLFILVVGNNYGSFYHQDKQESKIPDSVTLREFRRALETKIYKHIFINKYVEYDYKNYKRALDKVTLKYFQENEVPDADTDSKKDSIKREFDTKYHFPYDSYKYVFYFLDIIHELKENNAINTFETFADIKDTLRKQWAGFMFESLTRKDKVVSTIILPLEQKIDRIEKSILKLFESKTENKDNQLTFDLQSLARAADIENLAELQTKIQSVVFNILNYLYYDSYGNEDSGQRFVFLQKFTVQSTEKWLDSLKALMQTFKWSKEINSQTVFDGYPIKLFNYSNDIPYQTLFELYTIYMSLGSSDKSSFVNTICYDLNKNYESSTANNKSSVDDLPF